MGDFHLALMGGLVEEARRRGLDLREMVNNTRDSADFSMMVRGTGYLDVGCWVQGEKLYCEVYAGKWRDAFNMAWFDLRDPELFVSVVGWFLGSLR